jgi:regulator of protease activity HflC (stomatin/prohibitin superfamily)
VKVVLKSAELNALPRFQRAAFHGRRLLMLSAWLGTLALALLLAPGIVARLWVDALWRPLLTNNGAAMLLLAAGLHSAYWIARWRDRATRETRPAPADQATLPRYQRLLHRTSTVVARTLERLTSELFQALWLGALTVTACVLVVRAWDLDLGPVTPGKIAYVTGGVALLCAFGLLVLERYFAGIAQAEWPEAAQMAPLVRMAIATLLLSCIGVFFGAEGNQWAAWLIVIAGVLPMVVAAEITLRAALSLFVRNDEREEPRWLADSVIAALFRWPPRPLRTLQEELRHRFGIDLRQSWAFSFMRRALLPVLGVVAAAAWLCSGIREIALDVRGVYERFGKPVEVLGPGLHVGLPWPLARLRTVENGVVHELAASLAGDESAEPDTSTAEGPPPESANRLWDASHVSEKAQVIASASGAKQSFQVVNMDVRFVYRIGLDDESALASVYRTADVPALIRSVASRVLVRDFASRTLEGVLGEARTALARDIGAVVQADLQAAGSGVEILATLIESIHPPAGAANAYHSVQAAEIKAQATIARERGRAAEEVNEAQLQANMKQAKASAAAREARAGAEVVRLRFAAERDAYRTAGKAFLLEQYLSQLAQGLANAKLVVLDHRISGEHSPTIDLRTYGAAASGASAP